MLALARLGLPTPYPEGAVSAWASTKEPHKDIQTSALMGQVTPTEDMAPRTTAGGVVSAVVEVSDNPKVTAKSNKGGKQRREKCCLLMDTGAFGARNDKEKTGSA